MPPHNTEREAGREEDADRTASEDLNPKTKTNAGKDKLDHAL